MYLPALKKTALCLYLFFVFYAAVAQQRRPSTPRRDTVAAINATITPSPGLFNQSRTGPKSYMDIITSKAITSKGLFNIHKVEDKWFLEIADSVLSRDILVVNRLSKAAAGMRNQFLGYAGDQIGNNVVRFEKGPNNKLFLKKIYFDEISRDTSQAMYRAVLNSNIQPIIAAFDISAFSRDSTGSVIEITNFLNTDNDVLNFGPNIKTAFQIGSLQSDKSYTVSIKTYPLNVEIKTVKTYTKSGGSALSASPFALSSSGQVLTMEINSSMVLLPVTPMQARYYDKRVGFITRSYIDFDANPQGVKQIQMVTRWRLEPKSEDLEKYKRGELVEPKKPIIYYIDPTTPRKWVPYLIAGVTDWQVAFEKAGFKNAIQAKLAPTDKEDSSWSLEDARYSAIVYKPSNIENASGPNVHDPRSGEIIESHINWYHNVMNLLRNWYFVQTAAVDPRARKINFDDELMGQLIRFVSSHEVGHTLGLRHNYGSSSTVPVEKLRDKAFVEANGHTPSIMDYARFNYVAQPEDNITAPGLYPRIGDYDKWAIEWGYKVLPNAKSADEEVPILNKLTIERLKNKRNWFGTESNPDDPHSQNEDLGDNAMLSGYYGIKNLQRIVPNLITWTKTPNEDYKNLTEKYNGVLEQYGRYMGHVVKNIAGIYETPKTVEQEGAIYEFVSRSTQQEAMKFLQKQLFTTPGWLINENISNLIGDNPIANIGARQEAILNRLTSNSTFAKLIRAEATVGNRAYTMADMIGELQQGIWSEIYQRRSIDVYRRNLQKAYIEKIGSIINPPITAGQSIFVLFNFGPTIDNKKSDVISILKGNIRSLKADVSNAAAVTQDKIAKYHLLDVAERINQILNPGKG
ncbi:MAG: zinc-dependent metalloprotease [Chitinophagaceae bacterium]